VDVQQDRVIVLEIRVEEVLLLEVLQRERGRERVLVHERQLERLDARHAARRESRQRPHDVHHAIAHLVEKLRRFAAELHGPVALDLHAPVGRLVDALDPGDQERLRRIRHRRNERVQPEGDLLGLDRRRHRKRRDDCRGQSGRAKFRHGSSFCGISMLARTRDLASRPSPRSLEGIAAGCA